MKERGGRMCEKRKMEEKGGERQGKLGNEKQEKRRETKKEKFKKDTNLRKSIL